MDEKPPDVLVLAQLMKFLAEHGYPRSRTSLQKRIERHTISAFRIGTQWAVTKSEAQRVLEGLRAKDP